MLPVVGEGQRREGLPGAVDDVALLVLLRVKQHHHAPGGRNRQSASTWTPGEGTRRKHSPCWVGDTARVGVRGQEAAADRADAQNLLQSYLEQTEHSVKH